MWIALIILTAIAIIYLIVLYVVARVSVFPPRVPEFISPGQLELPQENVDLQTDDGHRIAAWWVPQETNLVLICAHGYVMNRCEFVPLAPILYRAGASLLFFDFRAHGHSDKTKCTIGPTESQDARAAIAFAKARKPGAKIVLLGSSMGAAACTMAALEAPEDVDGLILDGMYRSLDEAGKGWWLFLGGKALQRVLGPTILFARAMTGVAPKKIRMDLALQSLSDKPIMIINGTADPIVPKAAAEANQIAGKAEIEWFEGAGHGNPRFREPERYANILVQFLRRFSRGDADSNATSAASKQS